MQPGEADEGMWQKEELTLEGDPHGLFHESQGQYSRRDAAAGRDVTVIN